MFYVIRFRKKKENQQKLIHAITNSLKLPSYRTQPIEIYWKSNYSKQASETYLEPYQISVKEFFVAMVNDFSP